MPDIRPHPGPQTKALQSTAFETLYGGSRGPGKTFAGLLWLIKPYLIQNPRARSLVIRRNADDLSDWIDRARILYSPLGAEFAGKPAEIRFPSGYKIRTGHLKDEGAYTKYQGHEYQRILIEELTQIPHEHHYLQLIASCRSTLPQIDPRIFATTNPGGVGHVWVKKRFVELAPSGVMFKTPNGLTRIFIPGVLEDNPTLFLNDPTYRLQLEALKDTKPELYKAWRLGDWNTFAGQYFEEFNKVKHVIKAFNPDYSNKNLTFVAGLDWGRVGKEDDQGAFAVVFSILLRVDYEGKSFHRVITFKEVYGKEKNPAEWSDVIKNRVNLDKFLWIQADNQIFAPNNDNSVDIAQQFANADERFQWLLKPATKDRIGGWQNMHNWLSVAPDGLPYWIITENCFHLIRTLPELIHDTERNVEDVDTEGEDHLADAARYMFSAIQWIDARQGGVMTGPRKIITAIRPSFIAAPERLDISKLEAVPLNPTGGWREI